MLEFSSLSNMFNVDEATWEAEHVLDTSAIILLESELQKGG